jgi:hypothetical protein
MPAVLVHSPEKSPGIFVSRFPSSPESIWRPALKCDDRSLKLITRMQFRVDPICLIYCHAVPPFPHLLICRLLWLLISPVRLTWVSFYLLMFVNCLHPDRLWGPPNLPDRHRSLFLRRQSSRVVKLTTHLQLLTKEDIDLCIHSCIRLNGVVLI